VHAQYLNYVDPDLAFELIIGLNIIVMSLLGSRNSVWGPVLGAFILFPLQNFLVYWLPSTIAGQIHLALLGVVLILVARFMPDGLVTTGANLLYRVRRPAVPEETAPAVAGGSPSETRRAS
jgi:branched-chain amino acid transport system permease protein